MWQQRRQPLKILLTLFSDQKAVLNVIDKCAERVHRYSLNEARSLKVVQKGVKTRGLTEIHLAADCVHSQLRC